MTTIPSSTTTNYNTTIQPNSASNGVVAQQLKAQQQETREKVKPVAEQVYISKQAQQQYDTYVASANNANDRYNSTSTSSTSSQNSGTSTDQVLDTLKTVQNRQTARALAEYKQQQPVDTTPKPEPRESAKPTASIQAIA